MSAAKSEVRLFRLRENTGDHRVFHEDGSSTDYKSGDIIESEIDLCEKFVNKFDEVNKQQWDEALSKAAEKVADSSKKSDRKSSTKISEKQAVNAARSRAAKATSDESS